MRSRMPRLNHQVMIRISKRTYDALYAEAERLETTVPSLVRMKLVADVEDLLAFRAKANSLILQQREPVEKL